MESCNESELSGEGRGEWAHCWFTGMEEVHAEEWMVPLGQSTMRQLKIGLLHDAISEVLQPPYGARRTSFEVCKSWGRKMGGFPVMLLYFCDVPEERDMLG